MRRQTSCRPAELTTLSKSLARIRGVPTRCPGSRGCRSRCRASASAASSRATSTKRRGRSVLSGPRRASRDNFTRGRDVSPAWSTGEPSPSYLTQCSAPDSRTGSGDRHAAFYPAPPALRASRHRRWSPRAVRGAWADSLARPGDGELTSGSRVMHGSALAPFSLWTFEGARPRGAAAAMTMLRTSC